MILGKYQGTNKKVLCKCLICGHEWSALANNILHGTGCRECYKHKLKETSKKSHEQFLKDVSEKMPHIEILETYIDRNTKIQCRCTLHNNLGYAKPVELLNGKSFCKSCKTKRSSRRKSKTNLQFLDDLKKFDDSILALNSYVNGYTPIKFKCSSCGHEWKTTPNLLFNTKGCPECTKKRVSLKRRLSHEEFVKRVKETNSNINILGTYKGFAQKIECECTIHGTKGFSRPSNLLAGQTFCKKCRYKKTADKLKKEHSLFIAEMHKIDPDILILGKYKNAYTKIRVKCKRCDFEWFITPHFMLSGNVRCPSCGPIIYRGELFISNYLKENNIDFITQQRFGDLRGIGGRPLSYDFFIQSKNILIEYQGQYHDGTVKQQSQEDFLKQQEHDRRKKEYANKNGYLLKEIWYYDDILFELDKIFK